MSVRSNEPAFFRNFNYDIANTVFSFLEYPDYCRALKVNRNTRAILKCNQMHWLQNFYENMCKRMDLFGSSAWKEVYNVEITNQFDPQNVTRNIARRMLTFVYRNGPDAFFKPVVIPDQVVLSDGRTIPFCLNILNQLAKSPHAHYCAAHIPASDVTARYGEYQNLKAHIVCLKKNMIGLGKTREEQREQLGRLGPQYEEPPLLALATALMVVHATTGSYPFGNNMSRTSELLQGTHCAIVGSFQRELWPDLGLAPDALRVLVNRYSAPNEEIGMAVLRQFN